MDRATGRTVVRVDERFFRPAEVQLLQGCPEKAERELGWRREIRFEQLVERMAKHDFDLVSRD